MEALSGLVAKEEIFLPRDFVASSSLSITFFDRCVKITFNLRVKKIQFFKVINVGPKAGRRRQMISAGDQKLMSCTLL